MKRRGLIFRLMVIVVLAGMIGWLGLHREFLQATALEEKLQRFGPWAPILFVLLYACATALFVPGSALTMAGGALFGPLLGTVCNLIGATLGATLAFLIARYLGSDWVARRAGQRLARLIRGVEEEGWRFVAFVRLVPLFPFNLVNYALGLTGIRLGEYALTSFVCMVPGALAYTDLGYAGREAASGESGAFQKAMLALALLAAVAFLPRLVRRLRGPRFIDATALKRWLESGEKVALMDVRSTEEFRGILGHIAGARNISIGELSGRLPHLPELEIPIITI